MSDTKLPEKRPFLPARPNPWLIGMAQGLIRAQLSLDNHLRVQQNDLKHLSKIPPGAGMILASNHADEMDPRVCLELSRRSRKRFILMCNREAFDEAMGVAGRALQGLGYFSVERGAHDAMALDYAVDVVRQGKDVLVIFPEGEIFYLNEALQHFHSGAVEIGMKAILERRKTDPNWTAFIVPMSIKYHYDKPITRILEQRIQKMEEHLSLQNGGTLPERLRAIQTVLIKREQLIHHVQFDSDAQALTEEIIRTRREMLSQVEARHHETPSGRRKTIDEAWKVGAELRDSMTQQEKTEQRKALEDDIEALNEVAQLASWLPPYYRDTTSEDRLAEVVIKLERELFRIKRPPQLAPRAVFVKIAEPIDLGPHVDEYQNDPLSVRTRITNDLQAIIQRQIDQMAAQARG